MNMAEKAPSASRIFFIPVGARLLGVWSPITAFAPHELDCFILLHTKETYDKAKRLKRAIKGKYQSKYFLHDLSDSAWGVIVGKFIKEPKCDGKRVFAVCNGCKAEELPRFLKDSRAFADVNGSALRFVLSRDENIICLNEDGEYEEGRVAEGVKFDDTKELLKLRYNDHDSSLEYFGEPKEKIDHVGSATIRSLQLMIRFDLMDMNREELRQFCKKTVYNWRLHHLYDIDARSFFFMLGSRPDIHTVKRLKQDKIKYGSEPDWGRWLNERDQVSAPISFHRKIKSKKNKKASWDNDNVLVVALGPQSSTTLQTIWGHRDGRIVLVVDSKFWQKAAELAADIPAETISICPFNRAGDNNHLSNLFKDPRCRVNITPGDKHIKTVLALLALKNGREIWQLKSDSVVSWNNPEQSIPCESYPIKTFLRLHSNNIKFEERLRLNKKIVKRSEGTKKFMEGAKRFFEYLKKPEANISHLDNLVERRDNGKIIQSGSEWNFICDKGDWEIPKNYLDFLIPMYVDQDVRKNNGSWFELFSAFHLVEHVDDLLVGVKYKEKGGKDIRDELDIISLKNGRLAYFSCKTTRKRLQAHFNEARGYADKFLGRESTAVLLIPNLKRDGDSFRRGDLNFNRYENEKGKYREGLYLEETELGFVADVRCLTRETVADIHKFRRGRVKG